MFNIKQDIINLEVEGFLAFINEEVDEFSMNELIKYKLYSKSKWDE